MARRCVLTGKRPNVAHKVSHSNMKTKRRQLPNLQHKRLWWEQGSRFVRLRVSTEALRTIAKNGLDQFAKDMGVDLRKY